jgi:hypothetical protein
LLSLFQEGLWLYWRQKVIQHSIKKRNVYSICSVSITVFHPCISEMRRGIHVYVKCMPALRTHDRLCVIISDTS